MTTSLHINLNALDESFIEELRQRYGAAEIEILLPATPQDWLTEDGFWLLDTRAHAEASIRDQEKDYLSVDGFLYDRCCIVANGKALYEEVLHDQAQFPIGLSFERLLSVARRAYERKTGKTWIHIPRKSYETYSNEAGWED